MNAIKQTLDNLDLYGNDVLILYTDKAVILFWSKYKRHEN